MRSLLTTLLLVSCTGLLVACGANRCNMPMIEGPHVALNTGAWTATHRGVALSACLDDACSPITSDDTHLYQSIPSIDAVLSLRVNGSKDGAQVLAASTTLRLLQQESQAGPCGPYSTWSTTATLTSDGKISIPAAAGQK